MAVGRRPAVAEQALTFGSGEVQKRVKRSTPILWLWASGALCCIASLSVAGRPGLLAAASTRGRPGSQGSRTPTHRHLPRIPSIRVQHLRSTCILPSPPFPSSLTNTTTEPLFSLLSFDKVPGHLVFSPASLIYAGRRKTTGPPTASVTRIPAT